MKEHTVKKRQACLVLFAFFCFLLPSPASRAGEKDWTYNLAFSGWVTSNAGNRYHTFTPESAEKRAAEIAAAGFGAVITNGYHFRLNFTERDDDIRRIAKTIADACHKHGLKVIEHHDWTIHFYDGYPFVFQHPDWLQVDAADMVTRHRIFCINNREFQDAYLDYLRRYQRETDTDAYQLDEIQWLSKSYCGCRWCREKYRRDEERGYPPTHDPAFWAEGHGREDYRHWMRWRIRCLAEFRGRIRRELRKIRSGVKMFTYTTTLQSNPAGFARGSSIEEKGRFDDTVGTEVNSVLFAAYPFIYATQKSRLALGEAYHKPLVALNGQTPMTSYFVWAFGRTCRCSLWYHLSPITDGPSQEELLKWPYQMDDSVSRSAADIAIFLSSSTRDLCDKPGFFYHEYEGWLQALCLTHHDVKVLLESQLKPGGFDLSSVRLVVLPNAAALSLEQSNLLLDYVKRGGRVLLTYDSGTVDENGKPRLSPLFEHAGVRPCDFVDADGRSGDVRSDPIHRVLLQEDRMNAVTTNLLGQTPKFSLKLGRAGEYKTAIRKIKTAAETQVLAKASTASGDLPLLTVRSVERGRIYYVSAKLGVLAFEDKQLPTSKYRTTFAPPEDPRAIEVIGAVVENVLNDVPRFRVRGAPRGLLAPIYTTVRDGKPCRAVHLLNSTGRSLKAGDAIANEKKKPLPMDALPELTLELPGQVSSALLATPEKPGHVDLAVSRRGAISVVKIPAARFRTYGLVYVFD